MFFKRDNNQAQEQIQLQFNMQIADDTIDRTINVLQRAEAVTEDNYCPEAATIDLDFHKDKEVILESSEEIQSEVHLQILSIKHVVSPVREEVSPKIIHDTICWAGGRKDLPINDHVDLYILFLLKSIRGEQFKLPPLEKIPQDTYAQNGNDSSIEQLSGALIVTDKIQEEFAKGSQKTASSRTHHRGSFRDGLIRIKEITKYYDEEEWFKCFLREVKLIRNNNKGI
ncbi:hypothetical protein ACFL47_08310 [Candidatus Latescibacterota bacterium]